jgi:hypothetical protein
MNKIYYVHANNANLLKEKGFNEPCDYVIDEHGGAYYCCGVINQNSNNVCLPLIEEALTWIEKTYNFVIVVEYDSDFRTWFPKILNKQTGRWVIIQKPNYNYKDKYEALNNAIWHALKNM